MEDEKQQFEVKVIEVSGRKLDANAKYIFEIANSLSTSEARRVASAIAALLGRERAVYLRDGEITNVYEILDGAE